MVLALYSKIMRCDDELGEEPEAEAKIDTKTTKNR